MFIPTTNKIMLNAAPHSCYCYGNRARSQPCFAHLCATKWRPNAPDGICFDRGEYYNDSCELYL